MKFNTKEVIKNSGIAFGTSGARGLVKDFAPEVCAAFAISFVKVMQQNYSFKEVGLAIDNRPSSYAMAQACAAALLSLNIKPLYYGVVPTPALAYHCMQSAIPSIMITGSHIPFDRNGIKFYRPDGEISKENEQDILHIEADFSIPNTLENLEVLKDAADNYIKRYTNIFEDSTFKGKRIGIYEHSSAGRDLYSVIFTILGAEVIAFGRSDEFVPIDTEAVSEEDRKKALEWAKELNLDAIFSTDGDGDRPLVSDEQGQWLRGDILGLLCSRELAIQAVAIPVSCNTAISSCGWLEHTVLTKIGSPYVIAAFDELATRYSRIAGFEANGGFLLGSDVVYGNNTIKALPTRDAMLPALMLLASAVKNNLAISSLVAQVPARFTYSNRIQDFATNKSKELLANILNQPDEFIFALGFTENKVQKIDTTDGVRLTLNNDTVIHLRPSGNAPELRCYAEAATEREAYEITSKTLNRLITF